jgi:membrane-associated phospholipid phosphatase
MWLCVLGPFAGPVAAQDAPADSARAARERLFVPSDALYAGGFLLGTLAMYPVDLEVADLIGDPAGEANAALRGGAGLFRLLGSPGTFVVTGGLYLAGRVTDRPELADVGLHAGESLGMALAITYALKTLAGRTRPDEDPEEPYGFELGRGLDGDRYQSFPSGHSAAAFATAAALSAELRRLDPDSRHWAGPLLYGTAGLVGISRTYHNRHWASDVVAGAAVGTFSGWKVVRFNHSHPGNWLDRIFLTGNGFVVSWSW